MRVSQISETSSQTPEHHTADAWETEKSRDTVEDLSTKECFRKQGTILPPSIADWGEYAPFDFKIIPNI